jgi:NodT family efflux transporter outer membrane factor (OMF) lipoprotein
VRQPFAVLALLALAGCSAAPAYRQPALDPPQRWLAAGEAPANAQVLAGELDAPREWWKALRDPTLDELMAIAQRENFDLQRAQARLREARAARTVAASRLQPQVDGALQASRGNTDRPGFEDEVSLFDAAFDARWEIDLFGANAGRVRASEALNDAAEQDVADVLLSLRAEVARNYVELRGVQSRLALARDTLQARRDTLRLVSDLRRAGLKSELDVTQARAQVLAVEAQIPLLATGVTAAARRIDTLLGRAPGTLEAQLVAPAAVPSAREPAVLDEPTAILARRPDLRRAERDLAAADALAGAAVADLYPKVTLGGLFGWRGEPISGPIWSLAAGATAPLFNGGRLRAEVEAADARKQQRYFAYRQLALLALEDVEVSLSAYASAGRNLEALDRLVGNQDEQLALAQERYRRGLSPFIDVLDAQRSLYAAQSERAVAQAELAKAYVALNKAVGG